MGAIAEAFMNPTGPLKDEVTVITVTNTSTHVDLTAEAIAAALLKNELMTAQADGGDVYYRWSTATSGETVDEAAVAGSNRCATLFAGQEHDRRPPTGCQGIVVKCPAGITVKLRIWRGARPDY